MKLFKGLRSRWSRSYSSMSETLSEDYVGEQAPKGLRYSLLSTVLLLVLLILLGWYWSDEPDLFEVTSVKSVAATGSRRCHYRHIGSCDRYYA